ncbi:hypothetical protein V8C35DRAFT_284409 [Trichoderma chlorosporum]
MADESGEKKYSPAVTSYLEDHEGDLPCRLITIGGTSSGTMGAVDTGVAKEEAAAAGDNSPVSDAGTTKSWEMVDRDEAN